MMVSEEVAFYLPRRELVESRKKLKGNKEQKGECFWYFNKRQICGPINLRSPIGKIIVKYIYIMQVTLDRDSKILEKAF